MWLRKAVRWIIYSVSPAIDFVYDYLDLWQAKHIHEADHAKVRGVVLYTVLSIVMITIASSGTQFSMWFYVTLIAMLAAAIGERAFLSFLKSKAFSNPSIPDIHHWKTPIPADPREPDSRRDDERGE